MNGQAPHGKWCRDGNMLYIKWHYAGKDEKSSWSYCEKIPRTTCYKKTNCAAQNHFVLIPVIGCGGWRNHFEGGSFTMFDFGCRASAISLREDGMVETEGKIHGSWEVKVWSSQEGDVELRMALCFHWAGDERRKKTCNVTSIGQMAGWRKSGPYSFYLLPCKEGEATQKAN